MNVIVFIYCFEAMMFDKIKEVLLRAENIEFIASDQEILRYAINIKGHLLQSLDDLKEAEARLNSGDAHEQRTFGNIMSAANAEISAIEDPLVMTVENDVITIQKNTLLDPESTEFEMMFFYLQNHVIDFLKGLLGDKFNLQKLRVEIKEEGFEDK